MRPTDAPRPAVGVAARRRARRPAEAAFARTGALALIAVGIVALPLAGLQHGAAGLLAAAAGLGLVSLLFVAAAALQWWALRLEDTVQGAVVAGGFAVRVALYLAVLAGLSAVEGLHRPTLVLTTLVALVATLASEMILAARTPSLYWVQVERAPVEGASR